MTKKLLFLLCLLPTLAKSQTTYTVPDSAERILFLGNSITYAGKYTEFVEAYLRLQHPGRNWEFINVGLPSETLSGLSEEGHAGGKFPRPDLHERLERILDTVRPDFVFSCYGMNDGIYLPFDDHRFKKYQQGLIKLHEKLLEKGVGVILLTPPVYDEQKSSAYADVLDIYACWLISKHHTDGWQVVDIHRPMDRFLKDKRKHDPGFALAADGIHPREQGHWLMAREILVGLGYTELSGMENAQDAFGVLKYGTDILKLVQEKQKLTKDAWLTHIGHQRPEMKQGLPLEEALSEAKRIDDKIKQLGF